MPCVRKRNNKNTFIMIKLNIGNIAGDYTHYGSVSTDCKTVGEFMTQAVEKYKNVKITIDNNCTYDFNGGEKVRVTDDTEIESARYVDDTNPTTPLRIYVKTKPKPKYKVCSGWVNVYKNDSNFFIKRIYETEADAVNNVSKIYLHVDTVRIEWKEATE